METKCNVAPVVAAAVAVAPLAVHGQLAPDLDGEDAAVAAPRRHARARKPHADNMDGWVPVGCTLRKYEPESGSHYWLAVLPKGIVDEHGKHSHRKGWGFYAGISEQEAFTALQEWLDRYHVVAAA